MHESNLWANREAILRSIPARSPRNNPDDALKARLGQKEAEAVLFLASLEENGRGAISTLV